LELLYAKHISRFIAVSNISRERILKDLGVEPSRVSTVFNGVDTEFFCMPKKSEVENKFSKPTVVYMGRLMNKKGIQVLIRAIPKILGRKPDTHFLFVGGGNVPFYREMAQKMRIPERNLSFAGHFGYFERTKVLQDATVFVNPSFFELCSLSILEAMSCGTSVVASNVGGNSEIIECGKNGILVPPNRPEILAKCIVSLLEDETLNKEIGREARKTVERSFSSEKCARETCNVYRQILCGKN
jgi:glycosyltransferase involved in cell wall biosynthesis